MDPTPSKDYSWEWVTADLRLSQGPCELIFAYLVSSGATTDSHLYDSESASGRKIVTLASLGVLSQDFHPQEPIYCPHGLFVDVGTNVTGIFVQWRELKE